VLAGVVLLALAGFLRPRFSRVPKKIVPRETLPTWYRVADEVARAVGAAPVHGIILTADFNASFSQPGFPRRKTVLRLGLPLLTVLDTEERIALLGHELAHGANGDPRRGFVVGSAVDTLARWYWLLRPEQIFDDNLTGLAWLGGVLGSIASLALSVIPWSVAFVLVHLFWRDSQRAEYLADRLAVRVAGTAAMLRLLDALHLGSTVHFTMQRAVLSPTGGGDIFADVRESVASLPERERERIRRVERLEGSQLDATHPPTAFRIDLIGSNPVQRPAVSVNATDARALDDELTPFQPAVHSALLDRYRRRLYY
jgi:heat shock protein HtpX